MGMVGQRHVIDDTDGLAEYVAKFRDEIANGDAANGKRKRLMMSRYLFYVEVDRDEVWHGSDLNAAVAAYNKV